MFFFILLIRNQLNYENTDCVWKLNVAQQINILLLFLKLNKVPFKNLKTIPGQV